MAFAKRIKKSLVPSLPPEPVVAPVVPAPKKEVVPVVKKNLVSSVRSVKSTIHRLDGSTVELQVSHNKREDAHFVSPSLSSAEIHAILASKK